MWKDSRDLLCMCDLKAFVLNLVREGNQRLLDSLAQNVPHWLDIGKSVILTQLGEVSWVWKPNHIL